MLEVAPNKDQLLTAWSMVGFMTNPQTQHALNRKGLLTPAFLSTAAKALRVAQGERLTQADYKEIALTVIAATKVFR